MQQRFTASQISWLKKLFGYEDIPGSWLQDGTVTYVKLDPVTLNAALDTRYIQLTTNFSGHVIGTYNNTRIVLPTGGYINFDGTEGAVVALGGAADGIRIGNPTAGNYLVVEADGTLKFVGAATVWEDLRFPAQGINPPGAASDPRREATLGNPGFGLLHFEATNPDIVAGIAQLPHSWKLGSSLCPHVHWLGFTAGAAPNNVVRWQLQAAIVPIGATWDGTTFSYDSTVSGTLTAEDTHVLTPFDDIDMSAYASGVSTCIPWILRRVGSAADAADTYASEACLFEFDIHYEIDTVGSREETSK